MKFIFIPIIRVGETMIVVHCGFGRVIPLESVNKKKQ